MSLEASQIAYLQKTLGVKSVLLPETGAGQALPSFRIQGPEDASVYILSERELSAAESRLLSNILKAIGETKLTLLLVDRPSSFSVSHDLQDLRGKKLLAFSDLTPALGLQQPSGQPVPLGGSSLLLRTGELCAMLQGSPESIHATKRMVWGHLKQLS